MSRHSRRGAKCTRSARTRCSRTVSPRKSSGCWKVRARPLRARDCGLASVTSSPRSQTRPCVGRRRPDSTAEHRGLSGTVGPDEARDAAGCNVEVDVGEGIEATEADRDAARRQDATRRCRRWSSSSVTAPSPRHRGLGSARGGGDRVAEGDRPGESVDDDWRLLAVGQAQQLASGTAGSARPAPHRGTSRPRWRPTRRAEAGCCRSSSEGRPGRAPAASRRRGRRSSPPRSERMPMVTSTASHTTPRKVSKVPGATVPC